MHITVIGAGYVGLVTAACLSEVGHEVVCIEKDEDKIHKLADGICPFFEPGLEKLIKNNLSLKRLRFANELQEGLQKAQAVFIAVGTPAGEDGSSDLSYVQEAARQIGTLLERETLVVVKSTVPVGTCKIVQEITNRELKGRGMQFKVEVASNPEFLKEGKAIEDFMKPDRIIVGTTDKNALETLRKIYRPFLLDDPSKFFMMDQASSEITKYAANSMLAVRIAFMNELSGFCETVGADIELVRQGLGADPRIGKQYLYSGPGFGGSCFPKDLKAIIASGKSHGTPLSILEAVTEANEKQKLRLCKKIQKYFNGDLRGKKIAVWGLTFKPETDDVRESPSLVFVENLLSWGADVHINDPEGMDNFRKAFGARNGLVYSSDSYQALTKANALVLLTEWETYQRPDFTRIASLLSQKVLFDFRNFYRGQDLEKLGFAYFGVGTP